jgi:hypothetical protein
LVHFSRLFYDAGRKAQEDLMGLLDDIINDHKVDQIQKKREADEYVEELKKHHQREQVDQNQLEIQKERQTWFGDPNHTICGLNQGNKFEFMHCGPELDGLWVVAKVVAPLDGRAAERKIIAMRPTGGPPYVELTEEVLREELELGRIKIHARPTSGVEIKE